MSLSSNAPRRTADRNGAALIIALSMVVLASIIVLTFFFHAERHRRREANSAARITTGILARSGVDYVISRKILQEKIGNHSIAGGISPAIPGAVFYIPNGPAHFRPVKQTASPWDAVKFPNFLWRSSSDPDPLMTSPNGFHLSTTVPDASGRMIAPSRWNAPRFGTDPNFIPTSPEWLYFTPEGQTTTDAKKVIGRIAYVVYNTGSLLNINAAGHPSTVTDSEIINILKATPAGADLSAELPGFQDFVDHVRNTGTADAYNSLSVLSDSTNPVYKMAAGGFLKAAPGDTHILSRSELIRYALSPGAHPNLINELPRLTAWSRSYNVPAPFLPRTAPAQGLPTEVWGASRELTSYRIDGTPEVFKVQPGDPVLCRRFPLERLNSLANSETSPSEAMKLAIEAWFGLRWVSPRVWEYIHHSADASAASSHPSLRYGIMKLDEVRKSNREPNLPEILKARFLNVGAGSDLTLGLGLLTRDREQPNINYGANPDIDLHIMNLLANMIDAVAPGNIPTTIRYNSQYTVIRDEHPYTDDKFVKAVYGIKDIPYLYHYRWRAEVVPDETNTKIVGVRWYMKPYFANPHRLAPGASPLPLPVIQAELSGIVNDPGPIKIVVDGGLEHHLSVVGENNVSTLPPIVVSGSTNDFRTPAPASTGSGDAEWLVATFATPGGGIPMPTNPPSIKVTHRLALSLVMQGGLRYDEIYQTGINTVTVSTEPGKYTYVLRPDPRTNRFRYVIGTSETVDSIPAGTGTYSTQGTLAPRASHGMDLYKLDANNGNFTMEEVLSTPTHPARPVVLGRPFRSIGELGYVYRDQPWNSFNFSKINNQECTWVDCFSMGDEPLVSAGRWDLNTQSSIIIRAYLSKATKRLGSPALIDSADVSEIVSQIIGETPANASALNPSRIPGTGDATSSMRYPGDLVGRGWSKLDVTKEGKESVVRALASAGQTRTWNLFIDLIAQTGRMPASATDLRNFKFNTQGEQRLWVHVAIDRFTGKVVATHTEVYQE